MWSALADAQGTKPEALQTNPLDDGVGDT